MGAKGRPSGKPLTLEASVLLSSQRPQLWTLYQEGWWATVGRGQRSAPPDHGSCWESQPRGGLWVPTQERGEQARLLGISQAPPQPAQQSSPGRVSRTSMVWPGWAGLCGELAEARSTNRLCQASALGRGPRLSALAAPPGARAQGLEPGERRWLDSVQHEGRGAGGWALSREVWFSHSSQEGKTGVSPTLWAPDGWKAQSHPHGL